MLLVDRSAFYALADRSDRHHAAAAATFQSGLSSDRPVTSDQVVVETWCLIRARLG